jgi:hypothetical protein
VTDSTGDLELQEVLGFLLFRVQKSMDLNTLFIITLILCDDDDGFVETHGVLLHCEQYLLEQ